MDEQQPAGGPIPHGDGAGVPVGDGIPLPVSAAGRQAGPAPDSGPACVPVPSAGPAAVPVPGPGDSGAGAVPPGEWGDVPVPVAFPDEDDFDFDGHFAWLTGEIDAGRVQPPPAADVEGPALSLSLGDACDVDPGLLAALCGPDGLGGQGPAPAVAAAFGQHQPGDAMRPGPVLAALTAQAVAGLGALSDDQLVGVVQAARRLEALAGYQQTVAIAEFARRRAAAMQAAVAAGRPGGCRAGEFPGEELAAELAVSPLTAAAVIDEAVELVTRLPGTLAGMAAGRIDLARASVIAARTQLLSADQAGHADQVLAAAAPGARLDQLARRAAALELKLAPEAVAARKERSRREGQRVETRRETSGNACLAGRELDTAEAVACDAHVKAVAARLRAAGLAGTLGQLRARVLTDLLQGRDPLARITTGTAPAPGGPASSGSGGPEPGACPGEDRDAGGPAPLPALINLLVPAGALLGWAGAGPAQAAGWGLLDHAETTGLVRAASRHPATRWCATLIGPGGTAVAHACAAGRHPWHPPDPGGGLGRPPGPASPPDPGSPPPGSSTCSPGAPPGPGGSAPPGSPRAAGRPPGPPDPAPQDPGPGQWQQLAALLHGLDLTWEPVPAGGCDHRHAEPRYTPSRKLKHLLAARTQTCTAPGCAAQAVHCDIDHTAPWPAGETCPCNTSPKCRRHHRAKQAPGWTAEQPTPATTRWTLPSGRTHTTGPTTYDL